MLTIPGQSIRLCDGLSRRSFLRIGSLALGGLTLADVLRAEATRESGRSHKSVIMIFMPGGPSHLDMYDLKPDAPVEVRGEFRPIRTAVPGIQICEHLPKLARSMGRLVPIRTIVAPSSAATRYIASRTQADGLIVIETEIFSRSMPR